MAEHAREEVAEAARDRHERDPMAAGERGGRALGRVAADAAEHREVGTGAPRPLGEGREIAEGLQPGDQLVLEQSIEIAEGVAIAPDPRK